MTRPTPDQKRLRAAGWKPAPPPWRQPDLFPQGCWRHRRHPGPHTLAVALLLEFTPEPDGEPFAEFISIKDFRRQEREEAKASRWKEAQKMDSEQRNRMARLRYQRSLA